MYQIDRTWLAEHILSHTYRLPVINVEHCIEEGFKLEQFRQERIFMKAAFRMVDQTDVISVLQASISDWPRQQLHKYIRRYDG